MARSANTDAFVKNVFPIPGPFNNLPDITIAQHTTSGDTTQTTDVRPPKNVIWRIITASIQAVSATFDASGALQLEIGLFDATNFRLKQADVWRQGDGQNYESVNTTYAPGGSEALITYDKYLRLRTKGNANLTASVSDIVVIA